MYKKKNKNFYKCQEKILDSNAPFVYDSQGDVMESIVKQSLLYDFYGELLTQTQKSIYEDVVMNDLSYSELAREYGISRQGVFDMMKRCDKKLEDFEKKLKLVEKFENAREKVATIQTEIQALRERNENPTLDGAFADIDTNLTGLLDDF